MVKKGRKRRRRSGKLSRRAPRSQVRYVIPDRIQDRNSHPLPQTFKMKMTWYEVNHELDPGSATVDYEQFRANSIAFVQGTNTHQPLGFEEIMPMYNKFIVIGAKITCNFSCIGGSRMNHVGIRVGNLLVGNLTTDPITLIENGNLVRAILNKPDANGGGQNTTTLTQTVNTSKWTGSGSILSDSDLQGTETTNPSEKIYFDVFAYDQQAGDSGTVTFDVFIEYIVVFTDPVMLLKS